MARPTRLNAGDDISWTESVASTVTGVDYFFQDAEGVTVFTVAAVIASGTATFTMAGSATQSEIPGRLVAWRAVTDADGRLSSKDGDLILAPNPDGTGKKTHAQESLTALKAHLAGRVASGLESHTIDGQSIQKMSLHQARQLLKLYEAEVRAEQDTFAGNAGNGNRIKHRFV